MGFQIGRPGSLQGSLENDSTSEEFGSEGEEEEPHQIYRVPVTGEQKRKPKDNGLKKGVSELPEPPQSESLKVITAAKEMMQTFMDKMKEIAQPVTGSAARPQYGNSYGGRMITCYGCQQQGHILRNCPQKSNRNAGKKPENQGNRENHTPMQQQQGGTVPNQHLN